MIRHINVDSNDWETAIKSPTGDSVLYFVRESHLQNTFVVALHITSVSVD